MEMLLPFYFRYFVRFSVVLPSFYFCCVQLLPCFAFVFVLQPFYFRSTSTMGGSIEAMVCSTAFILIFSK